MAEPSRHALRGTIGLALVAILAVAGRAPAGPVEGRLYRVEGEVDRPGWYLGPTVGDAVRAAGGAPPRLTNGGIVEGGRVRIVGEWALVDTVLAEPISYPVDAPTDGLVHLNRASLAELERLPRVGPVMAARIVAARPFRSLDDLDRIKGIGPATFRQLAPLVAP